MSKNLPKRSIFLLFSNMLLPIFEQADKGKENYREKRGEIKWMWTKYVV